MVSARQGRNVDTNIWDEGQSEFSALPRDEMKISSTKLNTYSQIYRAILKKNI